MLSKYFIERPVLGNVIALITMLIGAVSIFGLPIAQYPPMTPPTVQVTTNWPGASAALVQQLVASNIENQVNGVENMLYMESDSGDCTKPSRDCLAILATSGAASRGDYQGAIYRDFAVCDADL